MSDWTIPINERIAAVQAAAVAYGTARAYAEMPLLVGEERARAAAWLAAAEANYHRAVAELQQATSISTAHGDVACIRRTAAGTWAEMWKASGPWEARRTHLIRHGAQVRVERHGSTVVLLYLAAAPAPLVTAQRRAQVRARAELRT